MSESGQSGDGAGIGGDPGLSVTLRELSEQALPLEVGAIELQESGDLRFREKGMPLDFAFVYRGIAFQARVVTGEAAQIRLTAELGRLPYTIESACNRRFASRMITRSGALPHAVIALGPAQVVTVTAEAVPPAPRTPASIMATITSLLLELKPHLEVLREALPPVKSASAA